MTALRNPQPSAGPAWLRCSWRGRDEHRILTLLAGTALTVAVALAVFGLPPVDLHGPLHRIGVMGPLCGGTRAARYTVLGDWMTAWRYNPLGILAVVASAAAVLRTMVGVVTSRWLTVTMFLTASRRKFAVTAALIALAAMTVRQQLNADLLISGT